MTHAFNLDRISDLAKLRAILRGRLEGLDRYTIDADGLRAFIRRLVKDSGTDEEWFSNVLLFLGQKPARKWNDADAEGAEYRLAELARRIHDLDKLRVHYDGQRHVTDAEFDVVLLRSLRKGGAEYEQVVCIDQAARTAIKTVRDEISSRIRELSNPSLKVRAARRAHRRASPRSHRADRLDRRPSRYQAQAPIQHGGRV